MKGSFTIIALMIAFLFFSNSILIYNLQSKEIDNEAQSTVSYDLLIISPKPFMRYIQPLVKHKNNHGVKTKLIDVEEVYNQMFWHGRDKAEKIKYFIKKAHEQWGINYVLLIGGRKNQLARETWWIPVRYSHLDRKYDEFIERKFLCDLYFADIYDKNGNFSSWDTNGNGIYGEWPEDKAAVDIPDLYPDVFVGRLPCRNRFDVRIMVKKIINYESKPCSDSWFKNMVVVAGDTYPEKTPYYDGEVYTQKGLDMMPGFNPVKLWTSDGSFKNWKDVVKAINKGCGFIWFSGHGNPASWGTYPPNDSTKWIRFRLRHMAFLFNGKKLPICITGSGCFNSMFNVSLLHSPWVYGLPIPKCWSWALTSKLTGGSIATIGATALSYESPDINVGYGGIEWLDMHFFGEYGLNNTDILGETWGNTITNFLDNFPIDWNDTSSTGSALIAKNVEQWLLIGDPSLKIGGY
ncbi:MAG: hypothetical protein JSW60_05600 [Thermoplasmatales archaeon]|nr:MAG: hypothetical protein JSW60_05600 [Thermoplasmatales archaeon]